MKCAINSSHTSKIIPPGIQKAIEFIKANYSETISLKCITQSACLSQYHFCREFKKNTGVSCFHFLNQIRIKTAKELIATNHHSITEICFSVGYNNLTHFERTFNTCEGQTPSQYRQKVMNHKNNNIC